MGHSKNSARRGFSLLELLVVVGVLFLLACVLLPAVSIARQRSQSERCLNNLHQLTAAWLMYASANSDRCANNFGATSGVQQNENGTYDTWCVQYQDWSSSAGNTNSTLLQLGQFGPYTGGNTTHFKCPADFYLSPVQVAAGFKNRIRSYSMSAFFGLFSNGKQGSDPTYQGKNESNPVYRQFIKVSDAPQPASMFLFLEEHPDSINDGYYDVGNVPATWTASTSGSFGDIPASFHNGACGFSFSDGHAEIHQWVDPRIVAIAGSGVAGLPVRYFQQDGVNDSRPYSDIHWMWSHSSVLFSNP